MIAELAFGAGFNKSPLNAGINVVAFYAVKDSFATLFLIEGTISPFIPKPKAKKSHT